MPKSATANLRRIKSEARGASLGAMDGVGRPHRTLAVEGKQSQTNPFEPSPSGRLGNRAVLGKASTTN